MHPRSGSAWRGGALFAAFVLGGCAAVAGVDFGGVHLRVDGADASPSSGTDGAVPDGTGVTPPAPGCAPGETSCNGACAAPNDPAYGCGATSCARCSVPFATELECRGAVCAARTCAAGRGDCDGDPSNGCEADLSETAHCGACTTACKPSDVCTAQGCALGCPTGTTNCGGSCVDLASTPAHCGSCPVSCPVPRNGDPACKGGQCGVTCHAGFDDCDGNPANGCEPLTVFFKDGDNDTYGTSASTTQACTAPPGFRAAAGDCDDGNPQVHPGQTAYFGAGYPMGAGVSFDYDCSGAEERSSQNLFPGCGGSCNGSGYLTAQPGRSGAGVDPYCGSTIVDYCYMAPSCMQGQTTTASPFPCR